MKKGFLSWSLKAIAAMVAAFIVLNLICVLYYNLAIHSHSQTGSTDYVWQKDKFYSRGTEGFAMGVTDENGFNNLNAIKAGEVDVLVMGSSHMEAFNVAQEKNAVAVLNEKFSEADMDMTAYNIGISGHTLARCLNNAENAIDEFKPEKYLVIETSSVAPDIGDMKDALAGELEPIESNDGGIVGFLQKRPFLRRTYAQLKSARGEDEEDDDEQGDCYELFDKLLGKVKEKCETEGVEIIILYNCAMEIDESGMIVEQSKVDEVDSFREVCEKNNVTFVNMYDSFKENYNETLNLPHGFSNSKVGSGHLNEYGHNVIATEIFEEICKLEDK